MTRKTLHWFLLSAFASAICLPQTPRTPLSRADILGRLAAGSTPSYVAHLVKTCGVSFAPGEYDLSLVRRAGGRGILVERLSAALAENFLSESLNPDPPYEHLAKCAELLHLGAVSQAETECGEAITENPTSPWPLIALTRCVEHPTDRREDVIPLLRRAVELAPTLGDTHFALSQVVSPAEMGNELAEAARVDPENLDVIQRGVYRAGVHPKDNQALKQPSAIEPDFAAAHAAAAANYATPDRIGGMQAAIRLEPDNPALHRDFARLYSELGNDDGEIAELAEAVRASPQSLYWHEERAFTLWSEDKQEAAIAAFRDTLKLFPDDSPASFRLVELLLKKDQGEDAIAELRRFIDATSGTAPDAVQRGWRLLSQKQLGDLLFQNREFQSAGAIFEEVLAEDPDARTMNALGRVRLGQGRLEDAMKEFRRAIQADTKLADPHYNLALCLARQNNLDEAIAENRRALDIDPEYSDARVSIGEALAQRHDTDGAIREFKQLLQADPNNAVANNDLAWIYATCKDKQKRDPKAALQLAQHAVELLHSIPGVPPEQHAAILDTLAEALLINGQVNEALKTEESAAELDPSNGELNGRLERFRQAAQPGRRP